MVTYARDIPFPQWLIDLGDLLQFAPDRHSPSDTVAHGRK